MMRENTKTSGLLAWIILGSELSFMLCIFAPLDLFYANMDEFWFSPGQMLLICARIFAIALAATLIVSLIVARKNTHEKILAFLLMMFMYLYIQGNYIPRNYGVMDGRKIIWGDHPGYAVASLALLAVCAALYFLLVSRFEDKVPAVTKAVSVFIFLIQIVTITTMIVQKGFPAAEETTVTTSKSQFDFSKDNNIIVFLLDTYDGDDLDYLLENDYDDQAQIFENFTYYQDTLAVYPTTKGALPQMLTGRFYENREPYAEYVTNAYKNNEIYDSFSGNGYELDVYTEPMFLSSDISIYENIDKGWYVISKTKKFTREIYKMVAFNYAPHHLKRFFFYDTEGISKLKKGTTDEPVFDPDVISFYSALKQNGISVSKEGNLLKFYHLDGVHAPATFGKDLVEDNGEYNDQDEAAGCNELLRVMFDKLKENDIYDSSTIIVLADHGHNDYSQNPVFLIKNSGEKHGFKVSDELMSYEYFGDIWQRLINGDSVDESFIGECAAGYGERRYLYYRWDADWAREYLPGMDEMICKGNASDPDSLVPTGVKYLADNEDHEYRLGKKLDFYHDTTACPYISYGISYGRVSWKAKMMFDIADEFEGDLNVFFNLTDYSGEGHVLITANDTTVYDADYGDSDTMEFIVPKEYVKDGHLELFFVQESDDPDSTEFDESPLGLFDITIDECK